MVDSGGNEVLSCGNESDSDSSENGDTAPQSDCASVTVPIARSERI